MYGIGKAGQIVALLALISWRKTEIRLSFFLAGEGGVQARFDLMTSCSCCGLLTTYSIVVFIVVTFVVDTEK